MKHIFFRNCFDDTLCSQSFGSSSQTAILYISHDSSPLCLHTIYPHVFMIPYAADASQQQERVFLSFEKNCNSMDGIKMLRIHSSLLNFWQCFFPTVYESLRKNQKHHPAAGDTARIQMVLRRLLFLSFYFSLAGITSTPMYFLSASGITMLPSACW